MSSHVREYLSKRLVSVEIQKNNRLVTVHFARPEVALENVQELNHRLFSYKYIGYDEDRLKFLLNTSVIY